MNFWITYGTTESGDDISAILWPSRPTSEEVEREYRNRYPEEYADDCPVCWKLAKADAPKNR